MNKIIHLLVGDRTLRENVSFWGPSFIYLVFGFLATYLFLFFFRW